MQPRTITTTCPFCQHAQSEDSGYIRLKCDIGLPVKCKSCGKGYLANEQLKADDERLKRQRQAERAERAERERQSQQSQQPMSSRYERPFNTFFGG